MYHLNTSGQLVTPLDQGAATAAPGSRAVNNRLTLKKKPQTSSKAAIPLGKTAPATSELENTLQKKLQYALRGKLAKTRKTNNALL
jgi:hypothetical protein